jgi:plastocyanin
MKNEVKGSGRTGRSERSGRWGTAAASALLLGLALTLTPGAAEGAKSKRYKAGTVSNGGTLTGIITMAGRPPKPRIIKVSKDQGVCGDTISDESLVVGPGGGLLNAVIEIKGIKKGKAWDFPATFSYDQKKCAFSPHVMIVQPRKPVTVKNSDSVKHNVHTLSKGIFNVNKTVSPGKTLKVKKTKIKKSGKVRVKCDLHKWMGGWWFVPASPYVALSDAKGAFRIGGIPPGKYKVTVWQEKLGQKTHTVEIKAGGTTELNVALKARKKKKKKKK